MIPLVTTMIPLLFSVGLLSCINACKILPGTVLNDYTRDQILSLAPIVVLANGTVSNRTTNVATMTVLCELKSSPSETIPSTIYVYDIVIPNSCQSNPIFTVGNPYILALQTTSGYEIFRYPKEAGYRLFSAEVMSPSVFHADDTVVSEVVDVCGITPKEVVRNSCASVTHSGEREDCTEPFSSTSCIGYYLLHVLLSASVVLLLTVL